MKKIEELEKLIKKYMDNVIDHEGPFDLEEKILKLIEEIKSDIK